MALPVTQQTTQNNQDGMIAACSGLTQANKAVQGRLKRLGPPSTTSDQITLTSGQTDVRGVHMQSRPNEPGEVDWEAGQWVYRLRVSIANANITWDSIHICRIDNGGTSLATVASKAQSIALDTAQVYEVILEGVATTGSKTDEIYIVCGFTNKTGASQTATFVLDQEIDTPIGAGGAVAFGSNF